MDLNIASGETVSLPPRIHQFKNLRISEGGILQVAERARSWLVLSISGQCIIDGEVIFGSFFSNRDEINVQTPVGRHLRHRFAMDNFGGDGAHGRSDGPGAPGGNGAAGTVDYGGGGGGGGVWSNGTGRAYPGGNADRWRAGRSTTPVSTGGNGAKRNRYGNGGLVCIESAGRIDGFGTINLTGSDGEQGESRPGSSHVGKPGCGGGAPGGEGGRAVFYTPEFSINLKVLVDGGTGGQGGQGPIPGGHGEDGAAGWLDIILG